MSADLLPLTIAVLGALGIVTTLLRPLRALGPRAANYLGVGFTAAFLGFVLALPEVTSGVTIVAETPWFPGLGVNLSFVLDGLSLLFCLLITGVGALVMFYSARYFPRGSDVGRQVGLLTLFGAAMIGLVLAGDAILLVIFWELTSIISFFLIGEKGGDARGPATRALLITSIGGLALLGAMVGMSVLAGDASLASILAEGDTVATGALGTGFIALLFIAAFTKSAQAPVHFWLPGAMVASTPVSTYLHAATMVKAGIYLLMRFAPVLENSPIRYVAVIVGAGTALFASIVALRQHDMKLLLAYSTVGQLGILTALAGSATSASLVAASVHILAHGAYKATLFMAAGVVENVTGGRDITRLSGLRRAMPLTTAITALSIMSMAGLPPFLGFVSKEETFSATLEGGGALGWTTTALLVGAAIVTFAYGTRLLGVYLVGRPSHHERETRSLILMPAVAAVFGGSLGIASAALGPLAGASAAAALGRSGSEADLALWHGLTPALLLSAVVLGAGALLARTVSRRAARGDQPVPTARGAALWERGYAATIERGRRLGEPFLTFAPGVHLGWIAAACVVAASGAALATGFTVEGALQPESPLRWGTLALITCTSLAVGAARDRMAAIAFLGLTGFLVAFMFALLGAPDLVLTQLLVETLTIVLVVLVFRRLPRRFHRSTTRRRLAGVVFGGVTGIGAALLTFSLTGRREISEAGTYYLEASPDEAGGTNTVNTILVDFRALDTLGEIAVLAAAAIGVFVLVRERRREP